MGLAEDNWPDVCDLEAKLRLGVRSEPNDVTRLDARCASGRG